MSELLASKLREEVFAAIRAHTAATVAEAEAATIAIIRLVGNAAALDATPPETTDADLAQALQSVYADLASKQTSLDPDMLAVLNQVEPESEPAPETADERQAAIVAMIRSGGHYADGAGPATRAMMGKLADWIESGEWRR